MIAKIIKYFDLLLSIVKSNHKQYQQIISRLTLDEITSIRYCVYFCSKCRPLKKKTGLKMIGSARKFKKQNVIRLLVESENCVKNAITCTLRNIVRQTIHHVIEEC